MQKSTEQQDKNGILRQRGEVSKGKENIKKGEMLAQTEERRQRVH